MSIIHFLIMALCRSW